MREIGSSGTAAVANTSASNSDTSSSGIRSVSVGQGSDRSKQRTVQGAWPGTRTVVRSALTVSLDDVLGGCSGAVIGGRWELLGPARPVLTQRGEGLSAQRQQFPCREGAGGASDSLDISFDLE